MTFTEAAMEVLRSAGEPLHFKRITELAIERNLLSHVGKTPEVTMSSRLATLVKKDRSEARIVKVRPGVFAFREHSMTRDRESAAATTPGEAGEAQAVPTKPERPQLPGFDVFPAEADDDDPILAGLEEGGSAGEEGSGRRRRRRRRRGKGGDADASGNGNGNGHGREEPREVREAGPREARESVPREARESREHRGGRDFRDRERDHRDRDRDRERDHRDRDRDRGRHPEPAIDLNREPGDGDLLGKDLADAAYHVLARGDRAPASFARIADQLVRRGRLTGSPDALAPTVAAALRADAARAAQRGVRSRFRIAQNRVGLTEWLLPREALRYEEQASQSAERQRDQVRRAFMQRLNDLPVAGFAEIIATWLNAEGVTALRAVRRPGSSGRELHFAGTRRRGTEETRLAIVVQRAGRDLDRETVIATRGSLHHYANASSAWLITTGRVTSGAREEAVSEGAAPCALFEGAELAQAMERAGIGIRLHHVPMCELDLDLLEALGDSGETRHGHGEGRDRDRGRRDERQHDRGRHDRDRDRAARGAPGRSEPPDTGGDGEVDELAASEEGEEGELENRETDVFELRSSTEEASDLASDEADLAGEDGSEDEAELPADQDDEHADEDYTETSSDDEDGESEDEDNEDEDNEDEDSEDDERDSR